MSKVYLHRLPKEFTVNEIFGWSESFIPGVSSTNSIPGVFVSSENDNVNPLIIL